MGRKTGFDSIASIYDWLVRIVFGNSMRRAQKFYLEKIPLSSTVLVLGGGTGFWLNELLRIRPDCKIVYIELSAKMIAKAKRRTAPYANIKFRLGTEELITHDEQFDAIITFCYLDLFSYDDLSSVIIKIKSSLKPDGLWLVTDFISTDHWHRVMVGVMYIFFRITTGLRNQHLPDWELLLRENGLIEMDEHLFYGKFIKSAYFKHKSTC